jgi:hypothetical protein
MRRRGTMLICDICHGSVFLKNLKLCFRGGWKFVKKRKLDICPACMARKTQYENRHRTKLTWDELSALTRCARAKDDIVLN